MTAQPEISVIMPTYNRAGIITQAIDSIVNQTFQNWELIIVDDGSTDDTGKIVEAIKDPRIRYLKQTNQGPAAARNYGISKAAGKWICYLDSDDELLPECLETMLKWLNKHPQAVFAFPRAQRTRELYENGKLIESIDDSGDTPPTFSIKDIFMRNAGFACDGFMHLRRLYSEGIKWDEKLAAIEDWEFMMSIGEKYPQGFLYVPVVLYKYSQRYGADNLVSQATYSTWADAFEYIYQKHKDQPMLKGQQWYPAKAEKWRKLQAEFEAGKRPPYNQHYFQKSQ